MLQTISAHIVISNSMSEAICLFMSASTQGKSLTSVNTVVSDSLLLAIEMITSVDTQIKSHTVAMHAVYVITVSISL
jgi:hypothetical protein